MIDAQRYKQVVALFNDACAVRGDDRRRLLDERCASDPDLRREVEAMLARDDGHDSPIDAIGAGQPLLAGQIAQRDNAPAVSSASFRIIRCLGTGGMGAVYLAEQAIPRRTVAVKFIRPGFASDSIRRRFEHEAHILGRLQHPGIAQIFEAGAIDPANPEALGIVMEFVDGLSPTDYANRNGLDIRDRVTLFALICEAVQHAHQRGVIHRDLKPSNILVDKTGQPKVLDFGVARAVADNADITTMHTQSGQLIGTLPYMSPEQVSGDPDDIDLRSDVYSLGVILFQLLAGRLPHDLPPHSLPDAARIIRDEEPVRLGSINRDLGGELETIVAKSLDKDRARRYQSAAALGEDLRRFLDGEPILARSDSSLYLLRKGLRRHRVALAIVAAFAILVAISAVTLAVSYHHQGILLAQVREQRDKAEKEAAKARAINEFTQSMLLSADPSNTRGAAITVREVLDKAAGPIDAGSLKAQPEVEAAVRNSIGATYRALGLYTAAEPHLRAALELSIKASGPTSPETVEVMGELGHLLRRLGKFDESAEVLQRRLDIQQQRLGANEPELGVAINDLAEVAHSRGDFETSEKLHRQALAILERAYGAEHVRVAIGKDNLAADLSSQGRLDEAEKLHREALAIFIKLEGPDHPDVGECLDALGSTLARKKDYAAAVPVFRDTLKLRKKLLGDNHPDVAVTENNLAYALRHLGQYDEAVQLYEAALVINRKELGDEHRNVAAILQGLAIIKQAQGDPAGATPLMAEALRIYRKTLGDDNAQVATASYTLAALLHSQREYAAAEEHCRRSLDIRRKRLPATNPDVVASTKLLASILRDSGRESDAESLLRDATSASRPSR